MKIEILSITPNAEKIIEEAGRTCYKSSDRINPASSGSFIKKLVRAGHLSVLEHAVVTFRVKEVSRALTHQLIRHRLCSFSQQSQRYVSSQDFSYVLPPKIESNEETKKIFTEYMNGLKEGYNNLIKSGIPKEDARYLLPNSCCTEIVFSCNFRQLRHIIKQRVSPKAQWEIRALFIEILQIILQIAPNCFFDLE